MVPLEFLLAIGCLVAFICILQALMKRFLDPLPVASQAGVIALGLLLILLYYTWYVPNSIRNRPPCDVWFRHVAERWCYDNSGPLDERQNRQWPFFGHFRGCVDYRLDDCNILRSDSLTFPYRGVAEVTAVYTIYGVPGDYGWRRVNVIFRFRKAQASECTDDYVKAKQKLGFKNPFEGPQGSIYYNGDWQFFGIE